MLIGCDNFNKKLLATTSLQLNVEENFGVCDRIYDVIITNWKQICSYIKLHKNKLSPAKILAYHKTQCTSQ